MAWEGFAQYAGNEIYNAARTEAYAKAAGAHWFKGWLNPSEDFAEMMGEHRVYSSPMQDDAPWTEPDYPESYDFFGFYPLEINGIENSTRQATVLESTIDGGIGGRIRHATRSVVFSGVLVGASEAAVEYGMRWLKRSLLAGPCSGPSLSMCLGDDFCYLSAPPCVDFCPTDEDFNPVTCLDPYWRTLKKFEVITGPSVTAKRTMSDGCATMWAVTFTGVSGNPFEYGKEVPILQGFMDPSVTDYYAPGVEGGYTDPNGAIYDDSHCEVGYWSPLQDPLCPTLIPPPSPPHVSLGCYTPPANWRRMSATIPAEYVPLWDTVVPIISVHATQGDVRNIRIRFYADPYESTSAAIDDGCAFCGDFVISFIPDGYTLTLDGPNERVYAVGPGGDQMRADALVFSADGNPMVWPELSCGFGYVVTFDMEQSTAPNPPTFDLTLVPRAV